MSKRISNIIWALAFVSALLCSIDASAASNSISDAFVATEISAAIDTVKTMTPEEAAANRRSTIISYIKASAKDTDIDKEGKSTFFVAVLND